MQLKKNFNYLFFLLVVLFSACSSNGCYEKMQVQVYANLYRITNGKEVSYTADKLTIKGVGSDSVIYKEQSLSKLTLSLRPDTTVTQFAASRTVEGVVLYDTITFYHKNQFWFESMDCGARLNHVITRCTVNGSIFKSVVIADSIVNTNKTEHVRITL